jgi:hypothetical protein
MKSRTRTPADPRPRPGALAAAVLFYSDPDRPSALELRHRPGCASERGEPCDCAATLVREGSGTQEGTQYAPRTVAGD